MTRYCSLTVSIQYYTKSAAGDILLAPPRLGEITTIELKNSTKYIMRRDAFLAKTEKVTFDLGVNHDDTVRIWKVDVKATIDMESRACWTNWFILSVDQAHWPWAIMVVFTAFHLQQARNIKQILEIWSCGISVQSLLDFMLAILLFPRLNQSLESTKWSEILWTVLLFSPNYSI